jgi:hypothetical protein
LGAKARHGINISASPEFVRSADRPKGAPLNVNAKLGEMLNVGAGTVASAHAVATKAPRLAKKVLDGEVTLNTAYTLVKDAPDLVPAKAAAKEARESKRQAAHPPHPRLPFSLGPLGLQSSASRQPGKDYSNAGAGA